MFSILAASIKPRRKWALILLFGVLLALPINLFGDTIYLTGTIGPSAPSIIAVDTLTGAILNQSPEVTGAENGIAVDTTIRTLGAVEGAQYTLDGTPTGTVYSNSLSLSVRDATTDGTHNYVVDDQSGAVYQTNTNYSGATLLFSLNKPGVTGISYDPVNNSLWLLGAGGGDQVADFSLSGVLQSSFGSFVHTEGLAFDPMDGTLWIVQNPPAVLLHYSTTGQNLGSVIVGANPINPTGDIRGAEFSEVPEPSSLILLSSILFGLVVAVKRKYEIGKP